jgi:mannose-6-phosphate isomerase-like protein (cupin superfamily)
MTRLTGEIKKGWGCEIIFATNDLYCGKLLNFYEGSKFSMHFHAKKDETWYVKSGKFLVSWIETDTAKVNDKYLVPGSTWHNPPLLPHQLTCIEKGTIVEVSTADSVEDNYRVLPGDSQAQINRLE